MGRGRYVLGERLGVGGMGEVYEAEDLARIERVAVKLAHGEQLPAELVATHMARELRIGRATIHPNLVSVLDGGTEAGQPFVVMELAPGQPLGILAAEGLSVRRIAAIVDQVLAGVEALHEAGFIHGDVKTDNVLVTRAHDGSDLVKVIDLGLAREQGQVADGEERVISGTPQYLAPECVQGGAKTVASELYAVGVILYELLTGTTPFTGGTVTEILSRQIEDEIMPPSQRCPELRLALPLERVVMRALEKDPSARFASAAEFRAALREATGSSLHLSVPGSAFSTTSPTLEWTRPELPPHTLARGSTPRISETHDPLVIVEAALDATRVHVGAHRLTAAREELEAALRLLEQEAMGDRETWRLLLTLSAINDKLQDHVRARRVARLALDSAARAGSEVGRSRAKALIERFAVGASDACQDGHEHPTRQS